MSEDGDGRARIAIGVFGTAASVAGLGIVSPDFKDAILSLINKRQDLGLYDAPPEVGWILIVLGVCSLLLSFFGQHRILPDRKANIGTLLTVKHIGFSPAVRDVLPSELPSTLKRRAVQFLRIDVTPELSQSPPDVDAALAKQMSMPADITAITGVNPAVDLGYCGIVQAPFQLLAGYQLMSWTKVRTFEWDRHVSRWNPLKTGAAPSIAVTSSNIAVGPGADIGIAVEISYAIAEAEMLASVPAIGRIFRVAIPAPAIDVVTHEAQVEEISRVFRAALDSTRGIAPGARVHVFCSASMSVGFALGRMISRTLHPPVRVYAYNLSAPKPYPWGIEINAMPGAPMTVRN